MYLFVALCWVLAGLFIASAVLLLLWNMTLPDLFRLPTINFWQSFRLLLIASLIFSPGAFLKINMGGLPLTSFSALQ